MNITPPIFTYGDLKASYPHRKSYESYLFRNLKQGRIVQIRKGLYGLVNPASGGFDGLFLSNRLCPEPDRFFGIIMPLSNIMVWPNNRSPAL
jgi:hypothetical protein